MYIICINDPLRRSLPLWRGNGSPMLMKPIRTASLVLLLAGVSLATASPGTPPCYDTLGAYQSPIDFPLKDRCLPSFESKAGCEVFSPPKYASDSLHFKVKYAGVGTEDQNIKFYNADPGSVALMLQGIQYHLTEFHFHSPSEHTFSGPPPCVFQMELHMVFHASTDVGHKLPGVVIGVPICVENQPSTQFDQHLSKLLSGDLSEGAAAVVSSAFFTSCLSYRNSWNFPPSIVYPGSLTTEPYPEVITWIVLNGYAAKTAVIVPATLEQFHSLRIAGQPIGHSRPVQKHYSRPLISVNPP